MTTFSANLGFLWTDCPLAAAIRAAKAAGFDAVECHWPYDQPLADVQAALNETGLPMLGLNTVRGGEGMFGLCALPNRVEDARQSIDQAIEYGTAIGAGAVHVMAGKAEGTAADEVFVGNLRYACDKAPDGMTILIEPLNKHDAPGYFLGSLAKACDVIEAVGHNRLKLMFDCYHVARTEGDVATQLRSHIDMTGHIQFAGVPDRGEPDRGQVDYAEIFALIADLGWDWPLGAEYRPSGEPDQTLQWMGTLR